MSAVQLSGGYSRRKIQTKIFVKAGQYVILSISAEYGIICLSECYSCQGRNASGTAFRPTTQHWKPDYRN